MVRILLLLAILSISLFSKERIYSIQLISSNNIQAISKIYGNLPKEIRDKSIIYVTNSGKYTVRYLLSQSATTLKKVAKNLKVDGLKGDFWVVNTDPSKAKEAFLKKYEIFRVNNMTKEAKKVADLLKRTFSSTELPPLKESIKKPQVAKIKKVEAIDSGITTQEIKEDTKSLERPVQKENKKSVEPVAKKSETVPLETQEEELENMSELLKAYEAASELSKITKSESAGFLDIYTREDLEKMQVYTLMDVLKLFTIPNITRSSDNISQFTKPTFPVMPPFAIRLYVNDHDMTSTSFGSAMMLWSDVPVEYIDHIEVYKSASSVEFGNEPGSVIIKLYTKRPEREEGGKVRVMADHRGSHTTDAYYAHTTREGLSYLFYANMDSVKRKEYKNRGYDLDADHNAQSFYANIYKDEWRFEGGTYRKRKGNFLGLGRAYTPQDGEIENHHTYLQLEKLFENGTNLRIGYDHLDCKEKEVDESGIAAGAAGYVSDYNLRLHDDIVSVIAEKRFVHPKGNLLVGGFYKYKDFEAEGNFDSVTTSFKNALHLYSLYLEESFNFTPSATFIASFKGDYYRYQKEIESKREHILRAGLIKNLGNFQFKAFYTKTYYAVPFLYLYGPDDTPYKVNPKLKFPEPTLTSFGVRYKNERTTFDARMSLITVKNKVLQKPDGTLFNKDKGWYHQYELKYEFKIDGNNLFKADIYMGENSSGLVMSPKYGAHLQLFNTLGKVDLYNQIGYRSNYDFYGVDVKPTFDYTAAVKYHATRDLSIGFKGENIFGTGYKQSYQGLDYAMPIFDRKYWLNLEYLF